MKLSELIKDLRPVECTASGDIEISGISYDSRRTQPGDLFVAIKGFESDGHAFISNAVKAGAAAVLCQERPAEDVPYIAVENSREALALVSAEFFDHPGDVMKVIGVTGTSGKTTTTHLIKKIIETVTGEKVGLIGTNGNMVGSELLHTEHTTPESYELQKLFRQMKDAGCSYVVMEVSSHSLVLDRVSGFRFAVAAYTNLSRDHLDFHGTMEAYAEAKSMLFSRCDAACINIDDEFAPMMIKAAKCPVITSSIGSPEAKLRAENVELSAEGVKFDAVYGGSTVPASLKIPGQFSVHNALTALSCCIAAGIDLKDAAEALAGASGVKGRVENVPTGSDFFVIIDYSHKPDALENVLRTLRPVTKGRLMCLFGCGGDRDRTKRPIMGRVAAEYSDLVIVTSDNPRTEDPQAIIDEILTGLQDTDTPVLTICDRIEAIHRAIDNASAGDVILLAGKGHEDYQIVGHEKHHMDEREIVADYLKEKGIL